jgi:hypothetical protein
MPGLLPINCMCSLCEEPTNSHQLLLLSALSQGCKEPWSVRAGLTMPGQLSLSIGCMWGFCEEPSNSHQLLLSTLSQGCKELGSLGCMGTAPKLVGCCCRRSC